MRILHVTPYYEPAYVYGGPVRSVALLCKALARAGADVTVLTTDANGHVQLDVPLGQPRVHEGVEVYYFQRQWPSSSFFSPGMRAACHALAPACDLVHITGLWTDPGHVAAAVSSALKIPYVISPRGMLMPWEFSHKAWKKRPVFYLREYKQLKASSGLHCTTPGEQVALDRFGLEAKGFLVPNGLDIGEFVQLPARGQLRTRLGIAVDDQVLLFLGRLHPKKGIGLTLAAFEQLAHTNARLQLVLAGPDEGQYTARIGQWASERGIASRVHVTGELKGLERLGAYADGDVFILLSESENFGMGVAEAMACGLPVIVSEQVGISDWINRVAAGVVIERTLEQAVRALQLVLGNAETAAGMGANGRRLVMTEFAADAIGRRMLAKYQQLVAE